MSIDAIEDTTTGISAHDRSVTVRRFVSPDARSSDFGRPGHIFPLRARPGGVLRRAGHTEATVDLARQAGLDPAVMVNVVSSGAGGSWALANLGPKIVADDLDPGFMIDLLCKDLRLVMELAQEAKLSLSGIDLAQGLFNKAQAEGLGRLGT